MLDMSEPTAVSEQHLQVTAILPFDTFLKLRFIWDPESSGVVWPVVDGDGAGRCFLSVADLEEEDFLRDLPSCASPAESYRSPSMQTPVSPRCLKASGVGRSARPNLLSPAPLNDTLPPAHTGLQAGKVALEPQGAAVACREGWEPGQQGALFSNPVPARLLEMNRWLASLQGIAARMEREIEETRKLVTVIETLDPTVDLMLKDFCEVIHAGITEEGRTDRVQEPPYPRVPGVGGPHGGSVMDGRSAAAPRDVTTSSTEASGWTRCTGP